MVEIKIIFYFALRICHMWRLSSLPELPTGYDSFSIFNVSVPPFQITSRVKGAFEWISIFGRSSWEFRE